MLLFVLASLLIRLGWVVAKLHQLLLKLVDDVVAVPVVAHYALELIVFVVAFPPKHAAIQGRVVELPPSMAREESVPLRIETGSDVRRRSVVLRIEMHYCK
jgi:hypothetical protein